MELNVNGDTVAETVTESLIEESIRSLTGRGDSFAILQSAPQYYIQTAGGPDAGFILEYRAGSEEEHYSSSNSKLTTEQVVSAFQNYHSNDKRWKTDFDWEPQIQDHTQSSGGLSVGVIGLGFIVLGFLIWKFFLAA